MDDKLTILKLTLTSFLLEYSMIVVSIMFAAGRDSVANVAHFSACLALFLLDSLMSCKSIVESVPSLKVCFCFFLESTSTRNATWVMASWICDNSWSLYNFSESLNLSFAKVRLQFRFACTLLNYLTVSMCLISWATVVSMVPNSFSSWVDITPFFLFNN